MRATAAGVVIALFFSTVAVSAGSEVMPRSGAYEVEVRLELPNLDDKTAFKTVEVCLRQVGAHQNPGFSVLSDNNPLATCPHSQLNSVGEEIMFEIECPGGNAARGSARYTVSDAGFRGRIKMNMGGKNMTMTEVQTGRRLGACPTVTSH